MACCVPCVVSVQLEMSTALPLELYSSMNEFVVLAAGPPLPRNSLTGIGLTFRTFSTALSSCLPAFAEATAGKLAAVQRAWPTRSPLNAAGPDGTLKVPLRVAPGATGSAIVAVVLVVADATDVQPFGTTMLNSTPVTGTPVVFVNVTLVSCAEPGANV